MADFLDGKMKDLIEDHEKMTEKRIKDIIQRNYPEVNVDDPFDFSFLISKERIIIERGQPVMLHNFDENKVNVEISSTIKVFKELI